jgi:hypothetical protein
MGMARLMPNPIAPNARKASKRSQGALFLECQWRRPFIVFGFDWGDTAIFFMLVGQPDALQLLHEAHAPWGMGF